MRNKKHSKKQNRIERLQKQHKHSSRSNNMSWCFLLSQATGFIKGSALPSDRRGGHFNYCHWGDLTDIFESGVYCIFLFASPWYFVYIGLSLQWLLANISHWRGLFGSGLYCILLFASPRHCVSGLAYNCCWLALPTDGGIASQPVPLRRTAKYL